MPVEQQVAVIWAATNGFVDNVAVENVRQWESDYLDYLESAGAELLATIRDKKALDDDITGRLRSVSDEFNRSSQLVARG
jgi:F-type H+-transporting ATPase subunit alpha